MFQPKLIINEELANQYCSTYINSLREALFTHFEKPYKTPNLPLSVYRESDTVYHFMCRLCRDCFHHSRSLEEHISRGSWILGYWCTHCFRECEHMAGKKLYCSKCIKLQIQKFKALQLRGLKKNNEPGIVKIFFNPCQLLEHMQMHESEEIFIHQLMLLPFPSGIGKEYYPHLKMISEALMDFMFITEIHIIDWLSQKKIHKWWRMAKGDNPVANIIKKYPFEVQQIKELLNCNNKVIQISESINDTSDVMEENSRGDIFSSRKSLNMNNSNPIKKNMVTLDMSTTDFQPNVSSTSDITFIDCGSYDNYLNNNINNNHTVKEINIRALSDPNKSILEDMQSINYTSGCPKPAIFVKKFTQVPASPIENNTLTKPNSIISIENTDSDTLNPSLDTIRKSKSTKSTSCKESSPQMTHKASEKRIAFAQNSVADDLKYSQNDEARNIRFLKTRKIQNVDPKIISLHKRQNRFLSPVLENFNLECDLSCHELFNQRFVLKTNKPEEQSAKKHHIEYSKSNASTKVINTRKTGSTPHVSSVEVPSSISRRQTITSIFKSMSSFKNIMKINYDTVLSANASLDSFLATLKKSSKQILEQFFSDSELMSLTITKNKKSGKSFLTRAHGKSKAFIYYDESFYRNKMFFYLSKMNKAKIFQRISHVKAISRKYSEKIGFSNDDIIESHKKLISILEDIAVHLDSSLQNVGDDYFGPLLNSISKEICITCQKVTKPCEYLVGFSRVVADLDYCLCYDFICYKCNNFQGSRDRFYAHLRYHKFESPYICPECNIDFSTFRNLNVHIWTKCFHPLIRRFLSCTICEINGFCSLESIVNHFVLMHSLKMVACNKCCMVFEFKRYCVSHMKKGHVGMEVINNNDPLQLTICQLDDEVIPIECYNYHMKNHKCVKESVFYECSFCLNSPKLFKTQESIKKHIYQRHYSNLSTIIDTESLKEISSMTEMQQLIEQVEVSQETDIYYKTMNRSAETQIAKSILTISKENPKPSILLSSSVRDIVNKKIDDSHLLTRNRLNKLITSTDNTNIFIEELNISIDDDKSSGLIKSSEFGNRSKMRADHSENFYKLVGKSHPGIKQDLITSNETLRNRKTFISTNVYSKTSKKKRTNDVRLNEEKEITKGKKTYSIVEAVKNENLKIVRNIDDSKMLKNEIKIPESKKEISNSNNICTKLVFHNLSVEESISVDNDCYILITNLLNRIDENLSQLCDDEKYRNLQIINKNCYLTKNMSKNETRNTTVDVPSDESSNLNYDALKNVSKEIESNNSSQMEENAATKVNKNYSSGESKQDDHRKSNKKNIGIPSIKNTIRSNMVEKKRRNTTVSPSDGFSELDRLGKRKKIEEVDRSQRNVDHNVKKEDSTLYYIPLKKLRTLKSLKSDIAIEKVKLTSSENKPISNKHQALNKFKNLSDIDKNLKLHSKDVFKQNITSRSVFMSDESSELKTNKKTYLLSNMNQVSGPNNTPNIYTNEDRSTRKKIDQIENKKQYVLTNTTESVNDINLEYEMKTKNVSYVENNWEQVVNGVSGMATINKPAILSTVVIGNEINIVGGNQFIKQTDFREDVSKISNSKNVGNFRVANANKDIVQEFYLSDSQKFENINSDKEKNLQKLIVEVNSAPNNNYNIQLKDSEKYTHFLADVVNNSEDNQFDDNRCSVSQLSNEINKTLGTGEIINCAVAALTEVNISSNVEIHPLNENQKLYNYKNLEDNLSNQEKIEQMLVEADDSNKKNNLYQEIRENNIVSSGTIIDDPIKQTTCGELPAIELNLVVDSKKNIKHQIEKKNKTKDTNLTYNKNTKQSIQKEITKIYVLNNAQNRQKSIVTVRQPHKALCYDYSEKQSTIKMHIASDDEKNAEDSTKQVYKIADSVKNNDENIKWTKSNTNAISADAKGQQKSNFTIRQPRNALISGVKAYDSPIIEENRRQDHRTATNDEKNAEASIEQVNKMADTNKNNNEKIKRSESNEIFISVDVENEEQSNVTVRQSNDILALPVKVRISFDNRKSKEQRTEQIIKPTYTSTNNNEDSKQLKSEMFFILNDAGNNIDKSDFLNIPRLESTRINRSLETLQVSNVTDNDAEQSVCETKHKVKNITSKIEQNYRELTKIQNKEQIVEMHKEEVLDSIDKLENNESALNISQKKKNNALTSMSKVFDQCEILTVSNTHVLSKKCTDVSKNLDNNLMSEIISSNENRTVPSLVYDKNDEFLFSEESSEPIKTATDLIIIDQKNITKVLKSAVKNTKNLFLKKNRGFKFPIVGSIINSNDNTELKNLSLTDDEKITLSKSSVATKLNNSETIVSRVTKKKSFKPPKDSNESHYRKDNVSKKRKLEVNEKRFKVPGQTLSRTQEINNINISKKSNSRRSKCKGRSEEGSIFNLSSNLRNKSIDSRTQGAIAAKRILKRKRCHSSENINASRQSMRMKDSLICPMPTLRLVKSDLRLSTDNFSYIPKKASNLTDVKKFKIAFCSRTANFSESCKFKCHLCSEVINTSWSILSDHYNKKHSHNYELHNISIELKRLSDCEQNNINQSKIIKKRKIKKTPSLSSKRKKRWYSEQSNVKTKDTFERTSGLLVPLESIINEEKHFKCKKCNERCIDIIQLRQHVVNNHRIAKKNLICLECGENFAASPSLQMHLKAFHGIDNPITYMDQYPAYAQQRLDFKEEVKISVTNQCHVCKAVFKDKSTVDQHLRVHGTAFLNKRRIEASNAQITTNNKKKHEENKADIDSRECQMSQGNQKNKNSIYSSFDKTNEVPIADFTKVMRTRRAIQISSNKFMN